MLTPEDIQRLTANAGPRNTGGPLDTIFDAPDPGALDSSGMDLSALGLGCGYGLGAALNPNIAPQGQHGNNELAAKLAAAKAADSKLAQLLQQINGAVTSNQALLLSSPKTAGLVSTAQNAISDIQGVLAQLEGSFWNGQNFNTFQGSSDSWNAMDAGIQAATQKLTTYGQLATQLSGGVATAQADANAAAQAQQAATDKANAAAAAASASNANAAATVNGALNSASASAAGGDFAGALAALSDPAVSTAAQATGMTAQVQAAIASVGRQKQQADRDEKNAAANAAASQAAQAAAAQAASAQAAANQATTQAGFDLQRFQAQLAADAAQHAQDAAASDAADKRSFEAARQARQDQLDKLQLILTAAPVLGKDVVAAALVNELGLDVSTAQDAADQTYAGQALPSSPSGVEMSGFFPETSF